MFHVHLSRALSKVAVLWRGKPRPAQADESLAALLARRDKVRAERPAEPSPDRFLCEHPQPRVRQNVEAAGILLYQGLTGD